MIIRTVEVEATTLVATIRKKERLKNLKKEFPFS